MQPTPSLDSWTSGFLIAVAMGIFLFVLLLSSRNRRVYPIALLVLAFSVILFQYVLYWTRYETVFPYLQLLPPLCYYSAGPLLYLYFLNLYRGKAKLSFTLHFLLAALTLITNIVFWMRYLDWTELELPFLFLVQNPWIVVGHMSLYVVLSLRLFKKSAGVSTQYTQLRSRWGTMLISLFALFILSYASYYVLVRFTFFNSEWDYFISGMMSLSIYTIGFFIFKQPQIFNGEFYANLFLSKQIGNDIQEQSMLNELYLNVAGFMETHKPYIENELRLVNLADRLGFSTHLLSKVINSSTGSNFNQFVNEYRLKEAEQLLAHGSDLSIQNIYFEVGFNNKATFYSAFRKKYGCTPTEFRESVIRS
jgi:AraC-like DNA-binding protein